MARQKTSTFDDFVSVSSKLPWWVSLTLALISYLILHAVASRQPVAIAAPGQFGNAITRNFITTLAIFGQLVLPMLFCFGALLSAITSVRQKKMYNNVASSPGGNALNEMRWEDFEQLVGEYFDRQGFQVSREGGNGPDGGIDLVLRQKGETYLVQCKHWKAYKVGVQPVREFYGVLASRGAAGGYFVTSGVFTDEAIKFAQGLNIEMVDRNRLRAMIAVASKSVPSRATDVSRPITTAPICPKCGSEIKKRVARQGANSGKEFWGCLAYPKCNGIRPLGDNL